MLRTTWDDGTLTVQARMEALAGFSEEEKTEFWRKYIEWQWGPSDVKPRLMKASVFQQERSEWVKSIFENFELLGAILDRYESVIRKRWTKKSVEKRRKTILEAWGTEMAATHRPDFAAARNSDPMQQAHATKYREAFIWPYINQEDLTKPDSLLLFLTARARNHPESFAAGDDEAMHIGLVSGALLPVILMDHIMMFPGRRTIDNYGELLITRGEDVRSLQYIYTCKSTEPGNGLLILEAQDRILKFLIACSKIVLNMRDISHDEMLLSPVQPGSAMPSLADEACASLAVMAAEAPYRVPAEIDFGRITTLLTAKQDEAVDHLWSLREDPGYFATYISHSKDHHMEMLRDDQGKKHRYLSSHHEHLLWARVMKSEVRLSYYYVEMFSELQAQAAHLQDLQLKYAAEVRTELDLPKPYEDAILKFRYYLTQVTSIPVRSLWESFLASPPMRDFHVREVHPEYQWAGCVRRKDTVKLDEV